MVLALRGQLDEALPVLADERTALRCCATGRVRNREEREDRAEDYRRVLRAGPALQRVAGLVLVVPYGGHDEVRAVGGDHARLREARARVVLLHGRVHAQDGGDETEGEVEGDEETVERAPRTGKERIQDAGESNRRGVHARGGTDEDPLPEVRVGLLPVLETSLRPGVREVDEEDKTEQDEDGRADECDIVPPEHEEAVRDEEGYDKEDEPEEDFRAPPPAVC